jgi:hypothetical protein
MGLGAPTPSWSSEREWMGEGDAARSRWRLAHTSAAVFRVETDARGVPRTTITYPELACVL